MSDETEKRMAGNYEVTQGIQIGDREVVFGVDETAEMPYLCAFYSSNGIFESYQECMVGDDYAEIMELFADRVKAQCVKVHGEQEKVTVPREKITVDKCIPMFKCGDIAGKVMAVKPEALRPEYRSAEHQLVLVTGGNGAREHSLGSACFCTNLYTGERSRWERYDMQGEVKPECLPEWAKERFAEIQKQEAAKVARNQNQNKNKDMEVR